MSVSSITAAQSLPAMTPGCPQWRGRAVVAGVAVISAALIFLGLTQRYHVVADGKCIVRIDRFTGRTWVLQGSQLPDTTDWFWRETN